DLSLLAFNVRVLAIAQDAATPLLERLRYIAIVASNLDEFFSVRGGRLKYAGEFAADDGETSNDSRHVVTVNRAARVLIEAQYAATKEIFAALDARGLRIRAVSESGQATRERLRTRFRSDIFPVLTPRAITATPGHSLPVVADRLLSFAVILRDGGREGEQLAELTIPTALDRFIELPDGEGYVATEDVIRQHLSLLYPGRRVVEAHLFRVTRFADFELDEQRAGNLVQAVDEHARQRRHQPIVRIEVEREMPRAVREMLLRELALEPGARPGALGDDDIFEIPGLMNLEALHDLAGAPLPGLSFPKFTPRNPLAGTSSLWDAIREDDLMFHHPYDDFSTSVVHFFENAAADPDVLAIRVALYRTGDRSPIADALRRAAEAGKQVTVFVELKARFDEERNVRWTRRLEESGVHVVHGLPGYKNHSKIALVARREAGGTRRYAHIGTGNYNAATARIYTDLGILTAREEVCDDISDLFNSLTGSSVPSPIAYRACLVAPHAMLPGLVQRIEREAANARAGCPARIRMKINGLADQEIVRALYDASRAGVDIDLGVRGICTLRPGVEGSSERIRVTSIVGRFLEHARIYAFDNDGHPEWFIGSADLRPRNLRRRVEVLVPIVSAQHRARLDAILETELRDPTAWTLGSNGDYTRTAGRVGHEGMSAQSRFARDADSSLREGVM
ncbi:MAG: polyphosphate kinase 1, partial [Gemmatimonadaceae bacterium]